METVHVAKKKKNLFFPPYDFNCPESLQAKVEEGEKSESVIDGINVMKLCAAERYVPMI